jgi:pyruvate,water dikinase
MANNSGNTRPTGDVFVRPFSAIRSADVGSVGGKGAALGDLYRELASEGVRVPNGFVVTADAYRAVLDANGLWPGLRGLMRGASANDVGDLARRAAEARRLVGEAPLPEQVANARAQSVRLPLPLTGTARNRRRAFPARRLRAPDLAARQRVFAGLRHRAAQVRRDRSMRCSLRIAPATSPSRLAR